mmetsp:Transcript_39574/g.92540  ORF Transcript_39574/g.92540 Transcript_39574/m.92540 type:complete len:205 (+) Transcript_39574:1095-1709(+)
MQFSLLSSTWQRYLADARKKMNHFYAFLNFPSFVLNLPRFSTMRTLLKRYKRRHERISFNKHRIDSLVMEELTGSPFVTDIHSFCGNSVVNEFGMISSSNLRDGYVSVTDRLYLAAQAATGVADLHGIVLDGGNKTHLEFVVEEHQRSAALVHLDIKPGNFIVTGKRIMKVHDFNLARFLEKNVTSGNLCFMKRSDCGIVSYSL